MIAGQRRNLDIMDQPALQGRIEIAHCLSVNNGPTSFILSDDLPADTLNEGIPSSSCRGGECRDCINVRSLCCARCNVAGAVKTLTLGTAMGGGHAKSRGVSILKGSVRLLTECSRRPSRPALKGIGECADIPVSEQPGNLGN
jgi:hypothetical protein